jgi:hypothetical protein
MTERGPYAETGGSSSRRHTLGLMLGMGAWRWLPGVLAAADGAPVRFSISESLVTDVNLNDARAAMLVWIKQISASWELAIEFSPKIFDTAEEILRRARSGLVDAVGVNILEYRQIADVLDSSQIIVEAGAGGLDQYLLLAKQNSGIQHLGDLQGRQVTLLKVPKMCIAPAWLSTLLAAGHFGESEQFFGSVTAYTKVSRVVLPVFFGGIDACVTSKQGFDTMCELNPQVAKELRIVASSPPLVVNFDVCHKNFHDARREKFMKAQAGLRNSVAGRQIATLFQFDELVIRDVSCLAPALSILDAAERGRSSPGAGSQKK